AEILVTGDQMGYAEVEIEAGTLLVDDLRLDVQHEGGDSDYGALRLRGGVSGAGGLTKAGAGIATLTGDGKSYTGATIVEQGVLQLTEPATPLSSSALAVLAGGQLRLTSGTGSGDPARNYAFGGTLSLSGTGRGIEIAEGNGNGKLGALRYDPGSSNDHAIISSPVSLAAAATVHVEGSSNLLEVTQALTGSSAFTKTGGGTLFLNGDQSAQSFPIAVTSGSLEIQGALGSTIDLSPTATLKGYGSTAAITGEGAVVLNQELLEAPASNASRYSFTLSSNSAPNVNSPAASLNGTAILENAPTGVLGLDFYLTGLAQGLGAISQGGIIVPSAVDLERALASAEIRVFSADSSGGHSFEGQNWRAVQGYSLAVVEASLGQAAPFSQVLILELTNESATPESFEAWRMATFNAGELADPAVSGPLASPFGDGIHNLLRYALGVPAGESALAYQPRAASGASEIELNLPFDSRRQGISVVLESSDSLADWSAATVLFNSTVDASPTTIGNGRIQILVSRAQAGKQFYRVRVTEE
ncbi:autotransporter-associated beta strand repeat-containing protein, partial [Akkermansiaceae bacterium]|nr:autotransporter-associated beta strand repeat-containing protein [Akkermansiaceae bacterium]